MTTRSRSEAGHPSQQHFQRSHIQYQAIGGGSHGDTSIASSLPTVGSVAKSSPTLVVVKFSKLGRRADPENSLGIEIAVLKRLTRLGGHAGIIRIVDYHVDGHTQWMTTPFHSGGNLDHFVKKFPDALSDSFIWQTIYCVTDALHWLFYGIFPTSSGPLPGWHAFHGDLCLPNLLLTPAIGQGPAYFPHIVIADFGSAEIYARPSQKSTQDFAKQQALDLCFFGDYSVKEMTQGARTISGRSTQDLDYWSAHFRNLSRSVDSWVSVSDVLNLLRSFHGAAAVRRLEYVEPLPTAVIDAIKPLPVLYEHK
ncbi:hypothetical protein LTR86_001257 [Recurvomyces mirabilis]|nr:hypothetical protein LTR86_001257 [Recurvomyces mirabilis]